MTDTIIAIATPPGQGAIGVIRVSGPEARRMGLALFRSANPRFSGFRPRYAHHGQLTSPAGQFLDDALLIFMPGPNSFTGEDVLEFQCHGGQTILRRVVEECLALGARLALAGEFSKRAVLNGRLDLTQAEAIMELVAAPSSKALGLAGSKLAGLLSQRIDELRTGLESLRVRLCLAVDFPEDEVEEFAPQKMAHELEAVEQAIEALAANYARAKFWHDGALVVLAGQVNVGKSSLLNAILGLERAIVTDIPGTTRDYLEESIQLDGLPVRLVDTAGLRSAVDSVEKMGIERSQELMDLADVLLLVVDARQNPESEDLTLMSGTKTVLVVANKMDLVSDIPSWFAEAPWAGRIHPLSAKTGQGLPELLARLHDVLSAGATPGELTPNLRQRDALLRAGQELQALRTEMATGLPPDILSVRLDTACAILGEISGDITPESVLNAVFDGFCIGK